MMRRLLRLRHWALLYALDSERRIIVIGQSFSCVLDDDFPNVHINCAIAVASGYVCSLLTRRDK